MNYSSTTESIEAFLLDTSQHLYLSRFTDLLYKGSTQSISHFSRSLSRQTHLFTSQTSLTHSILLPQGFFKVFTSFSSLGKFLISHFHAFHVLKPRFWGFWKNFGMSCCLNEFKISCIASHKYYNSIIMHLDVCKFIVCW